VQASRPHYPRAVGVGGWVGGPGETTHNPSHNTHAPAYYVETKKEKTSQQTFLETFFSLFFAIKSALATIFQCSNLFIFQIGLDSKPESSLSHLSFNFDLLSNSRWFFSEMSAYSSVSAFLHSLNFCRFFACLAIYIFHISRLVCLFMDCLHALWRLQWSF
jgi:hypothetical protein